MVMTRLGLASNSRTFEYNLYLFIYLFATNVLSTFHCTEFLKVLNVYQVSI